MSRYGRIGSSFWTDGQVSIGLPMSVLNLHVLSGPVSKLRGTGKGDFPGSWNIGITQSIQR